MSVRKKIIQIISESLGVEIETITPQSDFFEDLNANKLELADLILKVQQALDITIPEERLDKIKKVSDLMNEVEVNSDFLDD